MNTITQKYLERKKEFEEKFDHYNPKNDTGIRLPVWNGNDWSSLITNQKSDILTVIEAVENQVRNKRKELWAHYHELQQWKEQKIAVSGIDDFLHFLKEAKEEIKK